MRQKIYSYKDLIVWQRSMELVVEVYNLTENYPQTEISKRLSFGKSLDFSQVDKFLDETMRMLNKMINS
jgi:hypothetical protein